MRRIILGVWTALFVLFAAVQLNDPDPAQWTTIYGVSAVLCGIWASGRRLPRFVPFAVAAIAMLWSASLLPALKDGLPVGEVFGQWKMKVAGGEVEEIREAFGLLIVVSVLIAGALTEKKPQGGAD